jgi:hypothetical protein
MAALPSRSSCFTCVKDRFPALTHLPSARRVHTVAQSPLSSLRASPHMRGIGRAAVRAPFPLPCRRASAQSRSGWPIYCSRRGVGGIGPQESGSGKCRKKKAKKDEEEDERGDGPGSRVAKVEQEGPAVAESAPEAKPTAGKSKSNGHCNSNGVGPPLPQREAAQFEARRSCETRDGRGPAPQQLLPVAAHKVEKPKSAGTAGGDVPAEILAAAEENISPDLKVVSLPLFFLPTAPTACAPARPTSWALGRVLGALPLPHSHPPVRVSTGSGCSPERSWGWGGL